MRGPFSVGSSTHSANPQSAIMLFMFALVLFIAFIVLLIVYLVKKRMIFRVDYQGGNTCFNMRRLTQEEAVNFQRAVQACRDYAQKNNPKPQAQPQENPLAEQLRSYQELLQQGLISPEEYEAKRRQLLQL